MKLKNIFLTMGLAVALSSCGDDYLDTEPQSSTGKTTIFESTDNAQLAVNGLMRSMYRQYLSKQGTNGEPTTMYWFGDWQGDDVHVVNNTGWAPLYNSNFIDDKTSFYNYYMWYYYYKLIGNANAIIMNIDAATGSENERQFIKAQALTVRAYSYLRLTEYYCPRYSEKDVHPQGLPLRLDESTDDLAPSSQDEVYKQVFTDLNDAIDLYTASGLTSNQMNGKDEVYFPTLNLAYGIYARAALFTEDWTNAVKYAQLCRKNHSLMTVEEYVDGGFNTPNKEWIFCSDGAVTQSLHYYGFFAYNGSSSSSSASRTYPKAISKTLYEQIPATDCRKQMFLDPSTVTDMTNLTTTYKSTSAQGKEVQKTHPGKVYSTSTVAAYMQFKFQGVGGAYNVGDPCYMRASEMYLIEAEADCRLGNDAAARQVLTELIKDSGRDPEFSTDLNGADLLGQVKLYRRIELWNEGFRWYDLKRYGESRIRLTPEKGGNFGASFCVNLEPSDKNNWVYVYPNKETDYNKLMEEGAIVQGEK